MGRGASIPLWIGVSNLAVAVGTAAFPAAVHAQDAVALSAASRPAQATTTFSVPLVWNGQVLGDVIVQIAPDGAVAIESQSLRSQLIRLLTDTGVLALDEAIAGDPFVTPDELAIAGFGIEFDMGQLELRVTSLDGSYRPVEPLRGRTQEADPLQPTLEAANFSAYLNTNLNLAYRDIDGSVSPDVFLFGAARYRNVVAEIDGGFTEDIDEGYRFYRRAARLVYDEPEKNRRWSAGDLRLDNGGLARAPLIGGVALQKSRRTFDPLSSRISFGGREVVLTTPSTVEVIVNGAPYQTLDLQPGTYSLDDLPIRIGSNDVQLVVRDATGRERTTRFDYFFDPIELEAGEEEYTAALGVLATELSLEPNYSGEPVFVGNYRKALSDLLIVGGGLQVSEDLQLVSAEMRAVPQFIPGSFDILAAVSTGEETGFAFGGSYRLTFGETTKQKRFAVSLNYESAGFRSVGDLRGFRLENVSANATYSQNLTDRASFVVGGNYFSRGGGFEQSSVFADANYRIRDNVRATFGVEYGTGSSFGRNFGVRLGISILLGGRSRADASYQSRRGLARASISRGADTYVGSFGYSINLQDSDGNTSADGVVDYIGNRFEARASVGTSGTSLRGIGDNRTARFQIGTSIAFADGAFGIGRPIQDSFLLAQPHPTLKDGEVIAGRSLSVGEYEAGSGTFGAAVINRLTSYNGQTVQYDVDNLSAGYDIGSGVARVDPPYRSGYKLTAGNDRFVSAVGFIRIDGSEAQLAVGKISSQDDAGFEPQAFFTNSAGRFGIIGLAPGKTYQVRFNESGLTFEIEVPEDSTGLYRMQTIELVTEDE